MRPASVRFFFCLPPLVGSRPSRFFGSRSSPVAWFTYPRRPTLAAWWRTNRWIKRTSPQNVKLLACCLGKHSCLLLGGTVSFRTKKERLKWKVHAKSDQGKGTGALGVHKFPQFCFQRPSGRACRSTYFPLIRLSRKESNPTSKHVHLQVMMGAACKLVECSGAACLQYAGNQALRGYSVRQL